MNEVEDLLFLAWKKAHEQGVVLERIRFNLSQTVSADYRLFEIEASYKSKALREK